MHWFSILALASAAAASPASVAKQADSGPGTFIVKLKSTVVRNMVSTSADADNSVSGWFSSLSASVGQDFKPEHIYGFGPFRGFSARLDAAKLKVLQDMDLVEYVEEDMIMSINKVVSQDNGPWGLGRISSATAVQGANTTAKYFFDDSAGQGTCVYVIDTGIAADHPEFEGRAISAGNLSPDKSGEDGNGHGTHVAGTIGSKTFGVAKKASILGVKVLDGQGFGTISSVIAGIDFVTTDSRKRNCPNGVVANMSLGGPRNNATNDAIKAAVEAGVFVVVAAGNESQDSDNTSPASERSAFVVGASDQADAIASFSNFGPGVNVFAPGVKVLSTWIGGSNSTNTISGTSMASPHVAGLAAYLMGLEGKMTPDEIRSRIVELAVDGTVKGIKETTETTSRLAFNGVKQADASPGGGSGDGDSNGGSGSAGYGGYSRYSRYTRSRYRRAADY